MKIKIPVLVYCIILISLVSCRAVSVSPGYSPDKVSRLLGEPTRTQNFLLPEAPFFGPQESLTGLIPAGTQVEEWVYVQGGEELYAWFRCDLGELEGKCSLEKARGIRWGLYIEQVM